jgi:hypothetical protein
VEIENARRRAIRECIFRVDVYRREALLRAHRSILFAGRYRWLARELFSLMQDIAKLLPAKIDQSGHIID